MDKRALEYTRHHYDLHSNKFSSRQNALKARATGPGAPLKKFHNQIKRQLIDRSVGGRVGSMGYSTQYTWMPSRSTPAFVCSLRWTPYTPCTHLPPTRCRFAADVDKLLDLACGRGGDLIKWADSRVRYVKGVDLSPGEILEARQRFESLKEQRSQQSQQQQQQQGQGAQHFLLECEFEDSAALGVEEWRDARAPYDVVSCMFAIHYFFVSEQAARQVGARVGRGAGDAGGQEWARAGISSMWSGAIAFSVASWSPYRSPSRSPLGRLLGRLLDRLLGRLLVAFSVASWSPSRSPSPLPFLPSAPENTDWTPSHRGVIREPPLPPGSHPLSSSATSPPTSRTGATS
jgi:SAM-dependent methyltransferase